MTPGIAFAILVAIVVVVAVAIAWTQRSDIDEQTSRELAWLPEELAGAPLLLSEPRPIAATIDEIGLVAKPDRAYLMSDGGVKLVELKTRRDHRVYRDDVIELSVQRTVIERALERTVETEALVVTQLGTDPLARELHRVRLLSHEEVLALGRRYVDIMTGKASPQRTTHMGKCRGCAHRDRCRSSSGMA